MSKVKNYEKVLDVIRNHAPEAITKDELKKELEDNGSDVEWYRLSTYMWEIKTKAGVPVETLKEGRKVVGYKLASAPVSAASTDEATMETVEDSDNQTAVG